MGFRLAPRSMTLDNLELDRGRPPFIVKYLNWYNCGCIQDEYDVWWVFATFWLRLDFFAGGYALLSRAYFCVSKAFLLVLLAAVP